MIKDVFRFHRAIRSRLSRRLPGRLPGLGPIRRHWSAALHPGPAIAGIRTPGARFGHHPAAGRAHPRRQRGQQLHPDRRRFSGQRTIRQDPSRSLHAHARRCREAGPGGESRGAHRRRHRPRLASPASARSQQPAALRLHRRQRNQHADQSRGFGFKFNLPPGLGFSIPTVVGPSNIRNCSAI
jgi:hypothetical protein